MAQQPAGPFNLKQRIDQDAALITAVNTILAHTGQTVEVVTPADILDEEVAPYELLANILIAAINGRADLPEQKVTIEYLRSSQKMIIPAALGMNPVAGAQGRAPRHELLIARYWKMTRLNYQQVRELLEPNYDPVQIRTTVDAIQLAPGAELFQGWSAPEYYNIPQAANDVPAYDDAVFCAVSSALQFNCDLRDTGFLNRPDACVSDTDWQTAADVPVDRLRVKVRSRTLSYIAALNMASVANEPMAAFVRAFGIGLGIMPTANSAGTKEYKFDARMPPHEVVDAVVNYHRTYEKPLVTPCAQLLAIFGLMHLAKDHTFRTGDASMARINTSYINTLRTDVTAEVIDKIKANPEPYMRTAPHPFGLAQTYWLARALGAHGKLVSPLSIRMDVSPPPVQRLMIADAARREWLGLPVGRAIDTIYASFYPGFEAEKAKIKASPPSYSALHRLYGIPVQAMVSPEVMSNVQSMMPAVYGYVMVNHRDERDEADGLALALSLKNVQREQKGLVGLWENAWAKYSGAIEESGIAEFIKHMQQGATTTPSV